MTYTVVSYFEINDLTLQNLIKTFTCEIVAVICSLSTYYYKTISLICQKSTSEDSSGGEEEGVGVDLESELREFLESDTALTNFPLHDDKTIEEMLSES